jgi:hypothetical protein
MIILAFTFRDLAKKKDFIEKSKADSNDCRILKQNIFKVSEMDGGTGGGGGHAGRI